MNWGDGYRVDAGAQGSNASSWFRSLPPAWNVALAPHMYCALCYQCTPDQVAERFDLNWGHKQAGYGGRQYPVVLGEVGAGLDMYNDDERRALDDARHNLDFALRARYLEPPCM